MLILHSTSNRNIHVTALNIALHYFRLISFVAGSGPTCSFTQSEANVTTITCTFIYADFPIAPIYPVIVCTADGRAYRPTHPAFRTLISPNLYNSTTVIQISNSSAVCRATFAPPDVPTNPSYMFIPGNEPNFTSSVTGKLRRVVKIGYWVT